MKFRRNKTLNEASYGGAFDIEDDMFFTKEDIVDFGNELADQFSAWADSPCSLEDVYMTSPTHLVIEVYDEGDMIYHTSEFDIDMRKIRTPKDLVKKYMDKAIRQLQDSYLEYHQEDDF